MPIGGRAYHVRSTRTTDLRVARQRAEEHFADCLLLKRYGEKGLTAVSGEAATPMYRFDRVADDWLERIRVEAGSDQKKIRAFEDARNLLFASNGLAAYFKGSDLASISTDRIRGYLQFAVEHSKRGALAPTTKLKHLGVARAIFKFAHEKRVIDGVPAMPKVRTKDNPRAWFNPVEYRLLWRSAGFLARHYKLDGDLAAAAEMLELRDLIIFMVGTFIRPSEWKLLRQKHVEIVHGDHPHLRVAVPNGKTKIRKVVSMSHVVSMYERKLNRDGLDPEQFLFKRQYLNRRTAYERMADAFNKLLDETSPARDEFDRKRTLYSLRHTALMLRLLNGDNVDLLALARNAGTSVNQLERFYCSDLDPTMKLANLQSFRPAATR
jgi:site-specific recombinase XerD